MLEYKLINVIYYIYDCGIVIVKWLRKWILIVV